jgi:PhnB protein
MPASKKTQRTVRHRPTKVSPIPPGHQSVIPYLVVSDGVEALEFYVQAFGAKELVRNLTPDGKLIHGRLKIGDSMLMLADAFPGSELAAPSTVGTTTAMLHLYCKDVDAMWQRAIGAGATMVMPLKRQFWGEQYGQLKDPFGHRWSLSMRVAMSKEEADQLLRESMAAFARGEHPDKEPPFGDA